MKKLDKKGVVDQLQPIITALVSVAIVIVVSFLIMSEVQDQNYALNEGAGCNSTNKELCGGGYNATNVTINAMADIPAWLPIIIITIIGALLIGLVALFRRR